MNSQIFYSQDFKQEVWNKLSNALENFTAVSTANADINAITFWQEEVLRYHAILGEINATGVR